MQKELYFDINAEESGGSLYRIKDAQGNVSFLYNHSTYNADKDEIKTFETAYASFNDFWQMLIKDEQWFYKHPLYVHADQRNFIQAKLQKVNWNVQPGIKWQESHQRQWKKVLESKTDYYHSKFI